MNDRAMKGLEFVEWNWDLFEMGDGWGLGSYEWICYGFEYIMAIKRLLIVIRISMSLEWRHVRGR